MARKGKRTAARTRATGVAVGPPPPPLPTKRNGREKRQATAYPRYRPAGKALSEIRKYQRSTKTLIPKATFSRLVLEIVGTISSTIEYKFQKNSLIALLEASEQYIVGWMEDSYLIALHSKRVTLMAKDMALAHRIRGDGDSNR